MMLIPDEKYLKETRKLKTTDFSGIRIYISFEGDIIGGYHYKNGKKDGVIKPANKPITGGRIASLTDRQETVWMRTEVLPNIRTVFIMK